MKNKIVYVAVITRGINRYTCGVMSDLSEHSRRKLITYIYDETGLKFSDLLSLDINVSLNPKVKADNEDDAYVAVYPEPCFE